MNVIMNIILGLLITLAINIAISLQVGMNVITAESVVTTWFSSFVIGVTAGTIADPMSWALKLAGAIKANKFATWIIQSIILGLYFGTIILLGNMLISYLATGGVMAWLAGFAQWVLFVWVTAIVSVFILLSWLVFYLPLCQVLILQPKFLLPQNNDLLYTDISLNTCLKYVGRQIL